MSVSPPETSTVRQRRAVWAGRVICVLGYVYFGLALGSVFWDLYCGLFGVFKFINFNYFVDFSVILPLLAAWFLSFVLVKRAGLPGNGLAWPRKFPEWVNFKLIIFLHFCLLLCTALKKHAALSSNGCDLGIFENVLWNNLHGEFLYSSILGRHFFGEHFAPILLALTPIYAVVQSPKTLLVVQSAALSLGAWPVYRYAVLKLGRWAGLAFGLSYMGYAPLYGAGLFDFHPVALSVPLLAFAYYYLEIGKPRSFAVYLFLAMSCQEELALAGLGFGLYLLLKRKYYPGIALSLAALLLFLLQVKFLIPYFRGGPFLFADRYSHLGSNLPEILSTLAFKPVWSLQSVLTPEKLKYLAKLFGPLCFLPLFSPLGLLPGLPLLARVLLSNQELQFSFEFHFSAPLIPFLYFAGVRGAAWLLPWLPWQRLKLPLLPAEGVKPQTLLACLLILVTLATQIDPFWYQANYSPEDRVASFNKMLRHIPKDATVSAMNRLAAHLSGRAGISIFPLLNEAEYVVLDFGRERYEYPLYPEQLAAKVFELREAGYALSELRHGYVLLRKGVREPKDRLSKFIKGIGLNLRKFFSSFEPDSDKDEYGVLMSKLYPKDSFQSSLGRLLPPGTYLASLEFSELDEPVSCEIAAHRNYGEYSGTAWLAKRKARIENEKVSICFVNPDYNFISLMLTDCGPDKARLIAAEIVPLYSFEDYGRRMLEAVR